jgi:hypothetical protein
MVMLLESEFVGALPLSYRAEARPRFELGTSSWHEITDYHPAHLVDREGIEPSYVALSERCVTISPPICARMRLAKTSPTFKSAALFQNSCARISNRFAIRKSHVGIEPTRMVSKTIALSTELIGQSTGTENRTPITRVKTSRPDH